MPPRSVLIRSSPLIRPALPPRSEDRMVIIRKDLEERRVQFRQAKAELERIERAKQAREVSPVFAPVCPHEAPATVPLRSLCCATG